MFVIKLVSLALILCMPEEASLTTQVLVALDEAKMVALPNTALLVLSFQSTTLKQLLKILSPAARRAILLLHLVDKNNSLHFEVSLVSN